MKKSELRKLIRNILNENKEELLKENPQLLNERRFWRFLSKLCNYLADLIESAIDYLPVEEQKKRREEIMERFLSGD